MTVTMESLGRRIKTGWALLRRAAIASWQWIRHQYDAMMHPSAGQVTARQARQAEKQRRKEIRRQLKEKAVGQAA
jgi:hypothetical protein